MVCAQPTHFLYVSHEKSGLERELELERRKNREHHEQLREKDKEYAKLKVSISRWNGTER